MTPAEPEKSNVIPINKTKTISPNQHQQKDRCEECMTRYRRLEECLSLAQIIAQEHHYKN